MGVVVLLGIALTPMLVEANQATPTTTSIESTECTVEPRPFPLNDGTPAVGVGVPPVTTNGPYNPPAGPAVDEATMDGVTETVREAIACSNAGETRRVLSLFSDNRVRAFFAGRGAPTSEEIAAVLELPVTPVAEAAQLELVSVTEPRGLPNGGVGALVETRSGETTFVDFVYFVEQDGRWLIEDSVAIDSSTQVQASPAA